MIEIKRIEIDFGATVTMPDAATREIVSLIDGACRRYEADHPGRVMQRLVYKPTIGSALDASNGVLKFDCVELAEPAPVVEEPAAPQATSPQVSMLFGAIGGLAVLVVAVIAHLLRQGHP